MNIKKENFFQIFGLVAFVDFLLDKGHEAENLQKECLFLLQYHFPMEDFSTIFKKKRFKII